MVFNQSTQEAEAGEKVDLCEFKATHSSIVRPCYQGKNKPPPKTQPDMPKMLREHRIVNAGNLMVESSHSVYEVLLWVQLLAEQKQLF